MATCVPTTKAERIEPDLTCGPPIERKDVKVVDLQDFLTVEEAVEFVEEKLGEFRIVGRDDVHAGTAFGRAWKKAEKKAAKNGCNVLLITGRWSSDGATVSTPNDLTGQTTHSTYSFDHTSVMFGTTLKESDSSD